MVKAFKERIGYALAACFIGAATGIFLDNTLATIVASYPYGIMLAAWILPITGNLFIPVTVYFLCLPTRAALASRVEAKCSFIWLGVMLFVLADSLIGINKFAEPFPYSVIVIVTCYFSGQTLLAWGLLQHSITYKA